MVHETGTRNLLETIFYFDHALGELPLELLMAGAAAGSVSLFFAPLRHRRSLAGWLVFAVATDTVMVVGSWLTAGPSLSVHYFLQYVTRPDAPFESGSHWRYHLLSQVALMALPVVLAGAAAFLRKSSFGPAPGSRILAATWLAFVALTLVFGLNMSPFTDPQYLGHQARELFTHSLVTVPLAVAACLSLSSRKAEGPGQKDFPWRMVTLAAAGCAIPAIYLLVGVVTKSSYSHAQTSDPVRVICGHFFEHSFSFLVVPSHTAVFYLVGWAGAKR